MKLIESKAEYIPQEPGLDGIYKQIEKCGRICYKSEGNITEDSAKPFVNRLIASNHLAMLEHGTVYLSALPWRAKIDYNISPWIKKHSNPKYDTYQQNCCITCNYRMLVENDCLDDLQYFCSPTEFHEKRYTFKFTCSRAIANELVRHRVFSFAQESSRYCNYSKDKFDNQLTFIKPCWFDKSVDCNKNKGLDDEDFNMKACVGQDSFIHLCAASERDYLFMINEKYTPQQARDVLPLCTKSELIMTGFASDWKRLLRLRLFEETGKVHPDMKVLMEKLKAECIKNEIWDDIINSDG